MRKYSFGLFLIISVSVAAQKTDQQIIADSSFGWMKIYHYKGYKVSRTLDNRVFSAAQLSLCDSFCNWIQATYIPKGTIGDVRKVIGPAIGLYNPEMKWAPQFYGATSYTWSLYMKDGKPTPIQETEIPWGITANEIPGNKIPGLCTDGEFYFYMEERSPFLEGTPPEVIAKYNIKSLPQFKNFYPLHSTASRYDRNASFVESVLLCRDNKLPFIQVTTGDLLDKAEKMIRRKHEEALKDIKEKNKGNQKSIDYFTGYENEKFQKALLTLNVHREKYREQLGNAAMIPLSFDYTDFGNGQDIFTRGKINEEPVVAKGFPVYKLSPGTVEQSKKDQPLWIRITWNWALADIRTLHMHESIIHNFNFQYVYDFFFNPEKIKGKPYTPIQSPYKQESLITNQASAISKNAAKDPSIHFFEDFSTTVSGQKPLDWYSPVNQLGSYSKVVRLENTKEQWLEIKGHSGIIPNKLIKPLPTNFEISFDLAVPKGYPWGAKAFELYLGTSGRYEQNGKSILLRARPGFDGRPGETSLTGSFGSGYFEGAKSYYDAPGFSNNKDLNRIKITIIKEGEKITYKIDDKPITSIDKAVPTGTLFNWLQFSHLNSDGDNQKYFISNIKISKR